MAEGTQLIRSERITYLTPRDLASVLFRHSKMVLWTFSLVLGTVIFYLILRQPQYSSQMTILVNLERADPVVTPGSPLVQRTLPQITDQEVNSEMNLLRTDDLAREVVIDCGLDSTTSKSVIGRVKSLLRNIAGVAPESKDVKIAKAQRALQDGLQIDLIPKSSLISVSYSSPDPELSARVLNSLSGLYLKKHLAVRRPPGTLEFFKRQTDQYRNQLRAAEDSVDEFTRVNHVPSVEAERTGTLTKLTQLESSLHDIVAGIEVKTQQVQSLQAQMTAAPSRITTQMRKQTSPPPDQLQSTLLTLELKRTELLGTFQPDYRPLQELEKQIADAKAAIAASQNWQLVEQTTDRDATYEWLRGELEKATVDLTGLRSQQRATQVLIAELRDKATRLNELQVQQNDLVRSVTLTEDAYVTYQKKLEEARISDALDQQRILNVAIADQPHVPVLPSSLPGSIVLFLGVILAGFSSLSLAFGADQMNSSFRTPHEVRYFLDVPVVVSIPERCD